MKRILSNLNCETTIYLFKLIRSDILRKSKPSLTDDIVRQLSNKIFITKEYQPNNKLPNERELADDLNVSRNSIREAIKVLEAKGIVEIKRGRGTFVSSIPGMTDPFEFLKFKDKKKHLWNLFEVRLIFEPGVAKFAAERATNKEIDEIEYFCQLGVNQAKNGEDYSESDKKFHLAIAKSAHNEVIERFIPSIHESISEIHSVYPVSLSESWKKVLRNNLIESHESIFTYIKLNDAFGAEKAMRHHLIRTLNDLKLMNNLK